MNIFEWTENTPVTANNLNEMQNVVNGNTATLKDFLTLDNSITYTGADMTSSNGTVQNYSSITVRYNDEGTVAEISGTIYNNHSSTGAANITLPRTPLRPAAAKTLNICVSFYNNTVIGESVTVATDGTIVFNLYGNASANSRHTIVQNLNILA